jgi:hypothetical protein
MDASANAVTGEAASEKIRFVPGAVVRVFQQRSRRVEWLQGVPFLCAGVYFCGNSTVEHRNRYPW